jgi:catechol 2,3-dioxygenase-like lactoylglutathione lyase family enzyme
MLAGQPIMAFVATADPRRARVFYEDVLGLHLVADDGFALVFDANGTMLRLQKVDAVAPPPYTALGWRVEDIETTVRKLSAAGITFERYSFMLQDDLGLWDRTGRHPRRLV